MHRVRKDRETEFFEEQYKTDKRKAFRSYYVAVTENSYEQFHGFLASRCRDKRVLEYGCGNRPYGIQLAKLGANVTAIDIAPVAIEQSGTLAAEEGVELDLQVMDGDALEFPANSFDIVCGAGILHHLELDRGMREIARVLKPDGVAMFMEPLGHNPGINLFRRLTPRFRTEDEHPLRIKDIKAMRSTFDSVEYDGHHLFVLAAVPLRSTSVFPRLAKRLNAVDRVLLKRVPALQALGWQVIIKLERPRKTGTTSA